MLKLAIVNAVGLSLARRIYILTTIKASIVSSARARAAAERSALSAKGLITSTTSPSLC